MGDFVHSRVFLIVKRCCPFALLVESCSVMVAGGKSSLTELFWNFFRSVTYLRAGSRDRVGKL